VLRNERVDLAALIDNRRRSGAGSLREMARRAADAGTPISHASLGDYANRKVTSMPSEATRHALAAALEVTYDEVTAAAFETSAPKLARGANVEGLQHAQAFLRLTAGRSAAEIEQLLGVVEAALAAIDASRRAERSHSPNGTP
jgi:hypothetical protein